MRPLRPRRLRPARPGALVHVVPKTLGRQRRIHRHQHDLARPGLDQRVADGVRLRGEAREAGAEPRRDLGGRNARGRGQDDMGDEARRQVSDSRLSCAPG
jgi:hypothetical protein